MLLKKLAFVGVCVLLLVASDALADTVDILASADTYVTEQAPDTNMVSQPKLYSKGKGEGDDRHMLLQFSDLSALSGISSSDINSAYLKLDVDNFNFTNPGGVAAHKILAAGAYVDNAVTWNNFGSAAGGVSGTDYGAVAVDTTGDLTTAGWLTTELNVTQLLKDWLDAPASNYGVVLVASDGGNTRGVIAGIGGSGTPSSTAFLAVDYVPEPMTMAFLAVSGLGLLLRRRRA